MTVSEEQFAAVLLAAGASSRMGRPKPLLDYRGETFLDRQIALYKRICGSVIVVLGHSATEIGAGLQRSGDALFVLNPRPERGQLSSLQCGLRAVPANCRAVFFLPVDSPGVQASTLDAMLDAWRNAASEPDFVVPRMDGRRGHPVLMRGAITKEMLALGPGATARDVVHAHLTNTLHVDVLDPFIHLDIDDPAAYLALVAEARQ